MNEIEKLRIGDRINIKITWINKAQEAIVIGMDDSSLYIEFDDGSVSHVAIAYIDYLEII